MNTSFRIGLLSGLIVGVFVTAVVAIVMRPRPEPVPAPSPATAALLDATTALKARQWSALQRHADSLSDIIFYLED